MVDTDTGDLPGHLPTTSVVKLDNKTGRQHFDGSQILSLNPPIWSMHGVAGLLYHVSHVVVVVAVENEPLIPPQSSR